MHDILSPKNSNTLTSANSYKLAAIVTRGCFQMSLGFCLFFQCEQNITSTELLQGFGGGFLVCLVGCFLFHLYGFPFIVDSDIYFH